MAVYRYAVMGIDPGAISAAWAVLREEGASCDDVPVAHKMVDAGGFARLIQAERPSVAVVERVGPMPKQGVSSSFRFGQGVGLIQGVLLASAIRLIEVAPGVWKKHFRLGPDKEQARALALKLFPGVGNIGRKKDAGRAEALLIALWYRENGP